MIKLYIKKGRKSSGISNFIHQYIKGRTNSKQGVHNIKNIYIGLLRKVDR